MLRVAFVLHEEQRLDGGVGFQTANGDEDTLPQREPLSQRGGTNSGESCPSCSAHVG
jgi:hypothetical protein